MGKEDQNTMTIPPSDLEDMGTVPSSHPSFSKGSWGHCDQPHSGGICHPLLRALCCLSALCGQCPVTGRAQEALGLLPSQEGHWYGL